VKCVLRIQNDYHRWARQTSNSKSTDGATLLVNLWGADSAKAGITFETSWCSLLLGDMSWFRSSGLMLIQSSSKINKAIPPKRIAPFYLPNVTDLDRVVVVCIISGGCNLAFVLFFIIFHTSRNISVIFSAVFFSVCILVANYVVCWLKYLITFIFEVFGFANDAICTYIVPKPCWVGVSSTALTTRLTESSWMVHQLGLLS
jgi:hypothetical protein